MTVALTLPDDRAMVTVEQPPPIGLADHLECESFRAAAIIVDRRDPDSEWLRRARSAGSRVFASRGFDPEGQWGDEALAATQSCDVLMLNEMEASAFTGCDDPMVAARALTARVPLVIVTRGAQGMVGVDSLTGQEASVPALPVTPRNMTGAGDTTLAAFAFASQIPGLSLEDRLSVAAFIVGSTLEQAAGAVHPRTIEELLTRIDERADPGLDVVRAALQASARS